MRVLITGFAGFAGSHLAHELLAATDWRLWGTVFAPGAHGLPAGAAVRGADVQIVPIDLREPTAVGALFSTVEPDLVFHLAGQTHVPTAWTDPWGTFETNVRSLLNLLGAAAEATATGRATRVVVVGTSEVYGAAAVVPTDEAQPLAPRNPYATSKAAQDLLAAQFAVARGLDVVRVRPFNHIGPRQDDRFVLPAFARQMAEIEAGLREPALCVGNLDAERDLTDVRDIVRGYRLAAQHGRAGAVYNLGSGRSRPIRALVDTLLSLSSVAVTVVTDPARLRPADEPLTLCDASRARRELGWAPEIPFEQTVADVLDEWRSRVAVEAAGVAHAPG